MLFSATPCFAVQPSPDIFKSEYQESLKVPTQEPKFEASAVTKIPQATYNYLENVFSSFYSKVSFNTEITNSTFKDGLQSDVFSLPLIANNSRGIRLELCMSNIYSGPLSHFWTKMMYELFTVACILINLFLFSLVSMKYNKNSLMSRLLFLGTVLLLSCNSFF